MQKDFTGNIISIHAPARGATVDRFHIFRNNGISIHAPARGATSKLSFVDQLGDDFNPRSCERSDTPICFKGSVSPISIHAPARGATLIQM